MNTLLNDFHTQRSAATQPPPLESIRTGIQIHWREGAVKTTEIRRHQIEIGSAGGFEICRRPNPTKPLKCWVG